MCVYRRKFKDPWCLLNSVIIAYQSRILINCLPIIALQVSFLKVNFGFLSINPSILNYPSTQKAQVEASHIQAGYLVNSRLALAIEQGPVPINQSINQSVNQWADKMGLSSKGACYTGLMRELNPKG